jgi:hypothetical protein
VAVRVAWAVDYEARTGPPLRTDEMEQMRKLVRELRAGAKRLVGAWSGWVLKAGRATWPLTTCTRAENALISCFR